jgi:hypothetical protein
MLEVPRPLRIVASTETSITGTALQPVMVTVAIRIFTTAEDIRIVRGIWVTEVPVVTVGVPVVETRTLE